MAPLRSRYAEMSGNVRAFLAFRVLFNARFYYPVFAVFFVDLGLTLDQYAVLNVAWAASIVCFELPLGVVADRIGRRPLVVGAAALMVVEMAVLAFAPTWSPTLLFVVFLINRILSGLAEAAASGADEALAYDTLVEEKRESEWPAVLTRLQRLMSGAFIFSMVLGGLVYDPDVMNGVARALGVDVVFDQVTTARFPVYLTLLMSLGALAAALRMREPAVGRAADGQVGLSGSWRSIVDAGRWIRSTAFVMTIILFTLALDSIVRLFLTLTSSYYRLVGIPEAFFGVLGALFGGIGFLSPSIANRLVKRCSPVTAFAVTSLIALGGLLGIALSTTWIGAIWAVALALSFHLLGFFTSHYLNAATDSARRATVLSFKSLAGNLAYGGVGILYAVAHRGLAGGVTPEPGSAQEDAVLARTLIWFPIVLAAALVPLFVKSRAIPLMCTREE